MLLQTWDGCDTFVPTGLDSIAVESLKSSTPIQLKPLYSLVFAGCNRGAQRWSRVMGLMNSESVDEDSIVLVVSAVSSRMFLQRCCIIFS